MPADQSDTTRHRLHLFEAFGVELEYMLVDRESAAVAPVADRVIAAAAEEFADGGRNGDGDQAGSSPGDVELGTICWSNELCLHVLEIKGGAPLPSLETCGDDFAESVRTANRIAASAAARLMPGAMHPTMDPATEAKLWPHECNDVYRLFDRIFDCRGHGWSNLQSTHINLPFADSDRADSEFGRLHAAIRLLLPILPGLAASSPFVDGRVGTALDERLAAYRLNARRLPIVTGDVIPEPVFTREQYERTIYAPIADALAPFDPERTLNPVWVNARGCIARFDRGAIEIRLLDIQESPAADLAVLAAIVAVLRELVGERWTSLADQQAWAVAPLADLLRRTIVGGETTVIDDPAYLDIFGMAGPGEAARPRTVGDLWRRLIDRVPPPAVHAGPIDVILDEGTLATRMRRAVGADPSRAALLDVGRTLCDCLQRNSSFLPELVASSKR